MSQHFVRRLQYSAVSLAILICACSTRAADTLPAAPFAPLELKRVFSSKIDMSEIIIEGKQIRQTFNVKNILDKSIQTKASFSLPRFSWNGMSDDYFDKDFPELQVEVDGKPVSPNVIAHAYVANKDVTASLKRAGFSPTLVANSDPAKFPFADDLTFKNTRDLQSKGLFEERNGTFFPQWSASIKYQWAQSFPPRSNTRISYSYKLRPGFGITEIDNEILNKIVVSNCGSLSEIRSLLAEKQPSAKYILYEEFVIPTSIPSPEVTNIKFLSQPLNESFVPIATFGCFDNKDNLHTLIGADFSITRKKTSSFKFVLISYQKTEISDN